MVTYNHHWLAIILFPYLDWNLLGKFASKGTKTDRVRKTIYHCAAR
jgi:hypothetical protein